MEIVGTLVIIAIAMVIFGSARSRRRRNRVDEMADLRSAANTASLFILGAAAMQGLRPEGDATGHGDASSGLSSADFGGGFDGGGFDGGFGGGGDSGGSGM